MSKLKKTDYIIALLERIAYQTQGGPFDIKDYIERTVIPNAITEWDTLPSKDNQQGEKDTPSIRTGQQQGHRGKKPRFWRNTQS